MKGKFFRKTSGHARVFLGNIWHAAVTGEVLTAKEMNDCNDFGTNAKVVPAKFDKFKIAGSKLQVTMPSKSVVALEITGK